VRERERGRYMVCYVEDKERWLIVMLYWLEGRSRSPSASPFRTLLQSIYYRYIHPTSLISTRKCNSPNTILQIILRICIAFCTILQLQHAFFIQERLVIHRVVFVVWCQQEVFSDLEVLRGDWMVCSSSVRSISVS